MALFRKKQTTQIPELQEYYASQKKDSTAVAWLLALGSLLVTAAIFVGLFMGGRWLYRKINNKDTKVAVTVQTTPSATESTEVDNNGSANQPTGTVTAPPVSTSIAGSVPTPQNTPAQGVSPSQSPSTNQNAVAATTDIPNTGPTSTIAVFASVMVLSYYVHRRYILRKNS